MITGKRSEFEQRLAERGYALAEVAGCIVAEDGDTITVDETHVDYPRHRKPDAAPLAVVGGPGVELKALLARWIGIEADAGCACNSMAARMNALGPDWCESEAGLAEILSVMQAEHAKRWADGRTRLPWTDYGAKQLVRLACRRARAKAPSAD
jgi:hypothetical protein